MIITAKCRQKLHLSVDIKFDPAKTLAGLPVEATWQSTHPVFLKATYYDTFDCRLYNTSTYLVSEESSHNYVLNWHERDSRKRKAWATIEKAPDFSWRLPNGLLKNELEPLLDVRRLLPYILIQRRIHSFVLLNDDKKIILNVFKESPRAINPQTGRSKSLTPRLHIQALRDYQKPFKLLTQYLRNHYKLTKAKGLLTEAISAHQITPGNYSSKLCMTLMPDMRSDASLKLFLTKMLNTMERNEADIVADWDSEFLHDFRVAIRRSRSIINQTRQIMPIRIQKRLRNNFAWLNKISGPSRDMDVYLLGFPVYQSSLPVHFQRDLEPLRDFLEHQKEAEYRILVRAIHSARYRHFKEYLQIYLDTPIKKHSPLAHAEHTVAEVFGERIWHIYRKVVKEGKTISDDSPNEELHELRKTCKKFRYLLEYCRSIYPKKDIAHILKTLKVLQDNLGELQDCSVHIDALRHFSQQMIGEKHTNDKTLFATKLLINKLEKKQQKIIKSFNKRFKKFSTKENQSILKRLLQPYKPTKKLLRQEKAQ